MVLPESTAQLRQESAHGFSFPFHSHQRHHPQHVSWYHFTCLYVSLNPSLHTSIVKHICRQTPRTTEILSCPVTLCFNSQLVLQFFAFPEVVVNKLLINVPTLSFLHSSLVFLCMYVRRHTDGRGQSWMSVLTLKDRASFLSLLYMPD